MSWEDILAEMSKLALQMLSIGKIESDITDNFAEHLSRILLVTNTIINNMIELMKLLNQKKRFADWDHCWERVLSKCSGECANIAWVPRMLLSTLLINLYNAMPRFFQIAQRILRKGLVDPVGHILKDLTTEAPKTSETTKEEKKAEKEQDLTKKEQLLNRIFFEADKEQQF
ncbi:hypothetical protein RFI_04901, partial [Reticulomyxa filosa]